MKRKAYSQIEKQLYQQDVNYCITTSNEKIMNYFTVHNNTYFAISGNYVEIRCK